MKCNIIFSLEPTKFYKGLIRHISSQGKCYYYLTLAELRISQSSLVETNVPIFLLDVTLHQMWSDTHLAKETSQQKQQSWGCRWDWANLKKRSKQYSEGLHKIGQLEDLYKLCKGFVGTTYQHLYSTEKPSIFIYVFCTYNTYIHIYTHYIQDLIYALFASGNCSALPSFIAKI